MEVLFQIWDCVLGDSCVLLPESPTSPTAGLSSEVNTGIPFVHTHRMKVRQGSGRIRRSSSILPISSPFNRLMYNFAILKISDILNCIF